MAVAYDADTQSLQLAATNTTTFSHTCTGSDRALVVFVMLTGISQTVSSITYNSVGMTLIDRYQDNQDVDATIESWGLVAPASGANNVVVTLSANNSDWDVSAISFTGAHQSGGATTFNGVQHHSPAVAQAFCTVNVTSAVNDMVVSATSSYAHNGTAPTGGTQRWLDNSGSTNTQGSTWAGASSVTAKENWDAALDLSGQYNLTAFNITQSSAAAGIPKTTKLTLLGVG